MEAPRENTRLDRLLRELQRLGAAMATDLNIIELADSIGVSNSDFYRLLDEGHRRGFWQLLRDNSRITAIVHPLGDWKLTCSMRRYRGTKNETVSFLRKCLRCRDAFTPMHRFNFLCEGCRAFAAQAAP